MSPERTTPSTLRHAPVARAAAPEPAGDGFAALLGAAGERAEPTAARRERAGEPRHERARQDERHATSTTNADERGPVRAPDERGPVSAPDEPGRVGTPDERGPVSARTPDEHARVSTPGAGIAAMAVDLAPATAPLAGAPAIAPPAGELVTAALPGAVAPAAAPLGEPAVPSFAVTVSPAEAPVAAAQAAPAPAAPAVTVPTPTAGAAPLPVASQPVAPAPAVPLEDAQPAAAPVAPAPAADKPAPPVAAAPSTETRAPAAAPQPGTVPAAASAGAPAEPHGTTPDTPQQTAPREQPAASPAPAAGPAQPQPAAAPQPTPLARHAAPLHQAPRAVAHVLEFAVERGISHAKLRLRPADLGGVEIRLQTSTAGVTAQVVADSPEAARLLQQAAADLRRALERHDVNLLSLDVSTAGDSRPDGSTGASADLAGDRARHFGVSGFASRDEPAADDEPLTTVTTVQLSDGLHVDVLA